MDIRRLENLYVDIGPERGKLGHGTGYLTVPEPDLEVRGGEGRSSRPLDKGGKGEAVSKNKFFGPSDLSLV